jgi:outer membrane receptor for ferrienterochelin and colicins
MIAKNIFTFLIITFLGASLSAQQPMIHGNVYEKQEHGDHHHLIPLIGANVVWLGTTKGVATDESGHFHMHLPGPLPQTLVVSYIGYESDTIQVTSMASVEVVLSATRHLDEVVVSGRRMGAHYSSMDPILTQQITSAELQRAACCNLSEAFETNVSVDVSYSDAVSGAQQIQMLGLAGIYSQIMVENLPSIRGLGQPFGLSYIPGPWMDAISISKGSASVINGYESITGQINVELKKPEGPERLHYNAFVGQEGQLESSLIGGIDLGKNWSTMILAHGELFNNKVDHNGNSFLDEPLVKKYNIINRFRYENHGVMESQFGIKLLQEEREGGQKAFFSNGENWGSTDYYGFGINTKRYEAFAKTGFFINSLPEASIGTQLNLSRHEHNARYGLRTYDGEQNTFYANVLFQTNITSPDHKIVTGASFLYDDYQEVLSDSLFERQETVPGLFAEYTFHTHESFTAILAARVDFHNLYGTLFTPRMHLHFNLNEQTTVRASAGQGFRVPNPIAENAGLLVSNRQFIIAEEIEPEKAWNYGASLARHFELFSHDATFAIEYYRTDFLNQLVVDIDTDSRQAIFSNLDGKSFANNYQAEMKMEPLRNLEMTAAIRYTDVKVTINDELVVKPFVNRYRGLITGSYSTRNNNWQFDLTAQFNGPSRIPEMPAHFNMDTESPSYTYFLAQVTYRWRGIDLYAGGENLTNFKQHNPILNANSPFEDGFDGSMIWGPIVGRKFYMGVRYSLQR